VGDRVRGKYYTKYNRDGELEGIENIVPPRGAKGSKPVETPITLILGYKKQLLEGERGVKVLNRSISSVGRHTHGGKKPTTHIAGLDTTPGVQTFSTSGG